MVDATYALRVAGAVPDEDLRDVGAVTLAVDRVTTILYIIPDQSALCGLLSRLRALGIEVVEVHLVPDTTTLASTERSAVEPREGGDESTLNATGLEVPGDRGRAQAAIAGICVGPSVHNAILRLSVTPASPFLAGALIIQADHLGVGASRGREVGDRDESTAAPLVGLGDQ